MNAGISIRWNNPFNAEATMQVQNIMRNSGRNIDPNQIYYFTFYDDALARSHGKETRDGLPAALAPIEDRSTNYFWGEIAGRDVIFVEFELLRRLGMVTNNQRPKSWVEAIEYEKTSASKRHNRTEK